MTERDLELKCLQKAAFKVKCRYVCGWKTATVIFLALLLALGPVSFAVQAADNVAATRFGGALWKLKKPDENAVFVTEQKPPLEMEEQAYKQLQHEAVVLLKNENGALPLQQTVDCLAANAPGTERAEKLRSALIQEGFAVGKGTVIALIDWAEQALLQELSQKKAAGEIEKIVLLWDTDKPVQPDVWKDCDADAVLWTGGGDIEGITAILVGAAPSGALPNTGAYGEYPAPTGSVYTGYKYYETRYEDYVMGAEKAGNFVYREQVAYPFGFGLSYTTFAYSDLQVAYDVQTDNFAVTVTVTNAGSVVGREVVQIYAQAPYTDYDRENGVEKPAVKLVGFGKTGLLSAGESIALTVQVARQELASYDAKGAGTYILDAGDYYLTVAGDSHGAVNNILAAKGYTVESTEGRMDANGDAALTYKWTESSFDDQSYRGAAANRFDGGVGGVSRKDWEGTLSQAPAASEQTDAQYVPGDYATVPMPTLRAKNGLKLYNMKGLAFDDPLWQTLLDQLTFDEMAKLIGDGYRWTAPVASVQAPGACVGDLHMPVGEAFLSAAFSPELMYAIGWWAGEDAVAKGETALRCFGSSFEDSYLAGMLRAQQAKGIAANGVNVLLQGNTGSWYTEQAAREQYLRAFQDVAQLLPATGVAMSGGAKGMTEVLRQEWGVKGMIIAADAPAADGLLAGITVFDGQKCDVQKELAAYENDPVVVSAMRQACHYNLYGLVNSAAMNGIGEDTVVKPRALYVVTLLRVLMGLCAGAAVAFGILWYRGTAKWKQTEVYLEYQNAKNPPREEETEE
ncbi:MAG: fibronectin type III-like domain-contianing protein [Oscillospiraceae bacterium]|nr:fibronectin type III-like domain-contianing protein [Oscillospiraceae bacterium]